ncbi:MAG: flagellar filament capping protein FliD [Dehalococcoidia bacterium]|nr:flagellar filament capping protein FliD [Dehalococcoidia bacterium]
MADPVRLSNFFSSFDTESVITQLTAARSTVLTRLNTQITSATQQKNALADLQTKFSALLLRTKMLADVTSVSGKTATVTGAGVTAAAAPGSTTGSFTVNVTSVASGTTATGGALSAALNSSSLMNAASFATPVTAGTFTMRTATGGTATITVDPATQTLDDIVTAINGSGIGVTATIENDANGRANLLRLTSTQGAITLGTGGDTSNFLAATNLLASSGTTTRESTLGIARLSTSAKMDAATWEGGAPAGGDHFFKINGVQINYNAATDSLNDVISRINSSTAGVTARYDTQTDTIRLQQTKTGSLAIALEEDGAGGDFLSKTGLLAASQSLGSNAAYSIDGGATQYASSNTVSVNGTSVTFTAVSGGTPATVTVGSDTTTATSAITNFVAEFNGVLNAIRTATKASKDGGGVLSGDTSVRVLETNLRSMVTSTGINLSGRYWTLSEIGVSFGAVGSAVGATNELKFDAVKFKDAMAADPASVQGVLSEFKLAATLTPGGTGSIASIAGTYGGSKEGSYAITDDGAGNLTATFTPRDGTAATTTTGTITAGGTNSTLIPGVTITAAGALAAGSHTIEVAPERSSVIKRVQSFVEGLAAAGGVFQQRQSTYDKRIKDIETRFDRVSASIEAEMDLLRKKFAAMEQAQARAQTILQSISNAATQLSNSKE